MRRLVLTKQDDFMKKNLFYLFALICSMSLFTACSDDDDPVYPIEEELAGTYKGTLDIELDGTSIANGMPKNITIAKAGNNIGFQFHGNEPNYQIGEMRSEAKWYFLYIYR